MKRFTNIRYEVWGEKVYRVIRMGKLRLESQDITDPMATTLSKLVRGARGPEVRCFNCRELVHGEERRFVLEVGECLKCDHIRTSH